jgi:uncharacterized protein (TIGR01777 family)
MRVIITGGSGLIGQELTKYLSKDGHEVIILSRSPERVKNLPKGARAVKWDARTAVGWGELIDDDTAIINLAGAGIGDSRWTDERKKVILESRLNAAKAVIEAVQAAATKPKVVIQSSAVGYYGNRGDETMTESSAPAADYFLADVCVAWEKAIEPIANDVRLVIIRTGVVLTTQGGALPKMLTPFKLFAGGPFGDGQQWFPWIHISDEVAAIAFLLTNEETHGVYNLSAPNIMKNKQFAKVLGDVLNRPSFIPAPAPALRLALGEMAALVLDGQRAVSNKLQDAGFTFAYGEAKPALQDIIANER